MVINYAAEKGLKLDLYQKEVIEYIGNTESDEIETEMSPKMLASVSGGTGWKKLAGAERKNPKLGL